MRVLIADDHPMVADALSMYLREVDPDAEITISESLDQALNVVREDSRYDIVFLDKNMPGMHGLDGLTRFRKCLPDTPTVIISGLASRADILDAFERGAVGFIPKDMSSDAIIKAGGTITHHHAVGRLHRTWYDKQRPDAFAQALRAAKGVLDPNGVLNPGVLIDP